MDVLAVKNVFNEYESLYLGFSKMPCSLFYTVKEKLCEQSGFLLSKPDLQFILWMLRLIT